MCRNFNCLDELYRTEFGAVHQCNFKNCYWLEFAGERYPLNVSDFLFFKKEIDSVDIVSMLIDSSRHSDLVVLQSYRAKRCFVLNAVELLQLKDLLSAARFMIELNSVIQECLNSSSVSSGK
jgi:hypothetical protein